LKVERTYTERLRKRILEEVLASDIKSVAKRQGVSEQEIETMLRELAEELIQEKPQDLRRLGIDEIDFML
jgi:transposase